MRLPLHITIPAAILAIAGLWYFGGSMLGWALAGLGGAVGAAYFEAWYNARGPGAVVTGLVATWLELPGAQRIARTVIHVHDGMQPLTVRLGRTQSGLHAVIQTQVGTTPVAWRVWSKDQPAPSMDREGRTVGGPPVARAPALEAAFANVVSVETSDVQDAAQQVDSVMRQAILGLKLEAPRQWGGVTYDGSVLGVHLKGPIAADPERATALARSVWKVLT